MEDRGRIQIYTRAGYYIAYHLKDEKQGSQPGGRFGQTLAAFYLDNDNYEDLVVGAPMEQLDSLDLDYNGAIYIFYGNRDSRFKTERGYYQRLGPKAG